MTVGEVDHKQMPTVVIVVDSHISGSRVHDLIRVCRQSLLVTRRQRAAFLLQFPYQLWRRATTQEICWDGAKKKKQGGSWRFFRTHVCGHESLQGFKLALWQQSGHVGESLQESSNHIVLQAHLITFLSCQFSFFPSQQPPPLICYCTHFYYSSNTNSSSKTFIDVKTSLYETELQQPLFHRLPPNPTSQHNLEKWKSMHPQKAGQYVAGAAVPIGILCDVTNGLFSEFFLQTYTLKKVKGKLLGRALKSTFHVCRF